MVFDPVLTFFLFKRCSRRNGIRRRISVWLLFHLLSVYCLFYFKAWSTASWTNLPIGVVAEKLIQMGMARLRESVEFSTPLWLKLQRVRYLVHLNGLHCYKSQLLSIVLSKPILIYFLACLMLLAELMVHALQLFFSLVQIKLLDKVCQYFILCSKAHFYMLTNHFT